MIQDFLSDGHLDLEMQRLIRLNHTVYKFIFSTASNVIYHNLKELQTQESFVRAFNEWQSTAPGGWLPPPPPPGSFQFQVPVEVLQYAPYPPGAMVELKKINLNLLSEKDRMEILKKRQSIEEKKELEQRLEELNEKKKKLFKTIEKNFKKCKCFFYIENYFLYIMIFHLFLFHYSKWLTK